MKLKKTVFIIVGIVVILSSASTFLLEFHADINLNHKTFFENLSLSIFSSSILVCIIYFIEYTIEKKRILNTFDEELLNIIMQFNNLQYMKIDAKETFNYDDKFNKILFQYKRLNDIDIDKLGKTYSDIDYLLNNKLRSWIHSNIYIYIYEVHKKILVNNYHFNLFKEGEINNKKVLLCYISKLQNEFFEERYTDKNNIEVYNLIYYKLWSIYIEFNKKIMKREIKKIEYEPLMIINCNQ